jgi:hypothetical protein
VIYFWISPSGVSISVYYLKEANAALCSTFISRYTVFVMHSVTVYHEDGKYKFLKNGWGPKSVFGRGIFKRAKKLNSVLYPIETGFNSKETNLESINK